MMGDMVVMKSFDDYVRRIDLLEEISSIPTVYEDAIDKADICAAILHAPAADVVETVRYGHWVWNPDGMDWGLGAWCCSECKSKAETWWANDRKYNPLHCSGGHFCGNCGAQMINSLVDTERSVSCTHEVKYKRVRIEP